MLILNCVYKLKVEKFTLVPYCQNINMKTWEILAGLGFDKLLTMIIVNVHGPAIVQCLKENLSTICWPCKHFLSLMPMEVSAFVSTKPKTCEQLLLH